PCVGGGPRRRRRRTIAATATRTAATTKTTAKIQTRGRPETRTWSVTEALAVGSPTAAAEIVTGYVVPADAVSGIDSTTRTEASLSGASRTTRPRSGPVGSLATVASQPAGSAASRRTSVSYSPTFATFTVTRTLPPASPSIGPDGARTRTAFRRPAAAITTSSSHQAPELPITFALTLN